MKKTLLVLILAALLCTNAFCADKFKPVLRFVVTSDVHLLSDEEKAGGVVGESTQEWRLGNIEQFGNLFKTAYSYAKNNDTSYKKLDAVMVVGDFTDDGTVKQYETFMDVVNENIQKGTDLLVAIGNHEFYDTGENAASKNNTKKTYERFTQYIGTEPDTVNVINGYYFIGVSNDMNGGRCLSAQKCKWLKDQLEKAAAADKTKLKPIFVYTHFPPSNTVSGSLEVASGKSGSYDASYLDAVLKNFPQAVVFTGHYHKPADDPLAISQKDCTVIASCNMTYAEGLCYDKDGNKTLIVLTNDKGGFNSTENSDYTTYGPNTVMGTYIIIEVDKNNRVRVQYYDLKTDELVGEPIIIDSIGKKDEFTFTTARKQGSELPYFAQGSSIDLVYASPASLELSFPAAESKDNVRNYRCELYEDGKLAQTIYRMDLYYYFRNNCSTIYAPFSGLDPDTEYSVRIYAVNSYGVWGTDYLEKSFRTAAIPVENGICRPDVFSARFNETDYSIKDAVSGDTLSKTGSSAIIVDDRINRPAASFNLSTAYSWNGIEPWYERLSKALSFETEFRVIGIPTSTSVIAGNMQHGGCGFELKSNGNISFSCYFRNNGYVSVEASCPTGRYVHAVATYDGKTLKLYLDGELAASKEVGSIIWQPKLETTQFLAIGADSALENKTESRFNGLVSTVNIYSYPLTAGQVKDIYNSVQR